MNRNTKVVFFKSVHLQVVVILLIVMLYKRMLKGEERKREINGIRILVTLLYQYVTAFMKSQSKIFTVSRDCLFTKQFIKMAIMFSIHRNA